MYVSPRSGLGAVVFPNGSGGGVNPCNDTLYRLTHQAQCAAPPKPQLQPGYTPPPSPAAPPPPQIVATAPPIDPGAPPPAAQPTVTVTAPAAGEGPWYWSLPAEPPPGAGDVYVDVQSPGTSLELADEERPGFGLVEAALGAGLALVIGLAWSDRKRSRRR